MSPIWDHATAVLKFKEKGIAISRKDVIQGLDEESAATLKDLGHQGWEMVAVLPFSTGGVGMFSNAQAKTDAAVAFFKRQVSEQA